MSSYTLKIDAKTEAMVGWDPPLQSYFGQVYRIDADGERVDVYEEAGEEKDGTIFWIGAGSDDIQDIDELATKLAPHGVKLDRQLRAKLYADRDEGR